MSNTATHASPSTPPADPLASLLRAIASQIEAAMRETDGPAAILVESVDSLGKGTQTVARCLFDFAGSPPRVFQELMTLHDELHARAAKAATAIQFHDRLVQRLTHACSSLSHLAEFAASTGGSKSPADWAAVEDRIRGVHSMEQERALFDLLGGALAADGQNAAASPSSTSAGDTGGVELF